MFQTEFNHFFQSFSTPLLDQLMGYVSVMGYTYFLQILIVVVLIGYDFRKGFAFMHLILLTGILTDVLKNLISYPRPVDVDSSLMRIGIENKNSASELYKMGAEGLFDPISPEIVNQVRNVKGSDFGIPSGHVSATTAIWSTFSIFSGKKIVYYFSSFMIVLMAVSRMYLGRHFLADVLAGFTIGILISILFYYGIFKDKKLDKILPEKAIYKFSIFSIPAFLYLFVLPFAVLFTPHAGIKYAGYVIAVNLVYILLSLKGIPDFQGNLFKRLLRVLLAFAIFFSISSILNLLLPSSGLFGGFIKSFIPAFFMILLTVKFSPLLRISN